MTHPLILVPKYRDIIVGLRPGLCEGRYRIRKGKRGFGYISDTGWFPNVITNGGLNRIGTAGGGGAWGTTAVVGTGTATPDVTDTALQSLLASTTTSQALAFGNITASPRYGYMRITRRFAEGVAAGNLTEVGYGWTSTALFSRALILDGSGNPTTITVLSDEYLDVTYELRFYVNESDFLGSIVIGGSGTHDYTERALDANGVGWGPPGPTAGWANLDVNQIVAFNGTLAALTASSPNGTGSSASSFTNTAYSNGTLYRDRTGTFDLNAGNVAGGLKTLKINQSIGARQVQFDPVIAKDGTKTFNISWRTPWARKTI